jgi:pyruvate carboxylase subunit B
MIKITDVTLRDGHQSLLATRMRTEDLLDIARILEQVGFHAVEVWGGATYDACLRYLKEDPFERLAAFKEIFKTTKLQMLLRGQNLVGYRHYGDDVVKEFIRLSAEGGIDIFRIFDALNDLRNLRVSIESVKQHGKHAQGALSYTVSPVHTLNSFVHLAKEMVILGCDSIAIKDMAGLLTPYVAYDLIKALKESVDVPIELHTHSTAGFAFGTHLKAIEAGCDIVDTCNSALAEGTSHPCTQSMVAALKSTPYDTGLDLSIMEQAAEQLRKKRTKYQKFESEYNLIDTRVLVNQIPGGMISNLANQLRNQNALDRMDEVLEEIPHVRKDFGYPPLVTPSSQIVGTQAVLNVTTGKRYHSITTETRQLVRGAYGKTPAPLNEDLISKVRESGDDFITCRPADILPSEMSNAYEKSIDFAKSDTDVISYAMFGQIAKQYMTERNNAHLTPEPLAVPDLCDTSNMPNQFNVTVHGENYHIEVEGVGHKSEDGKLYFIRVDGEQKEIFVETDHALQEKNSTKTIQKDGLPEVKNEGHVAPSMPGNLIKINVKEGEVVKKGETVAIVEAMKMEHEILATRDGQIIEIYAKEGLQVSTKYALMLIG